MKLTEDQVRHVARLARLALSADEVQTWRSQLSAILDHVEALSEVDTTDVPPTASGGASTPHLREDVAEGELGTRAALSNAPQVSGSSFAIPRVLE